jgi:hypothetical protein
MRSVSATVRHVEHQEDRALSVLTVGIEGLRLESFHDLTSCFCSLATAKRGGPPRAHATEEQLAALAASGIPVYPTLGGFNAAALSVGALPQVKQLLAEAGITPEQGGRETHVIAAADDDIRRPIHFRCRRQHRPQ